MDTVLFLKHRVIPQVELLTKQFPLFRIVCLYARLWHNFPNTCYIYIKIV